MAHEKTFVIVGGGSSGWMTAAFLTSVFENTPHKFVLVESSEVPSIGVGEATVHSIRGFLAACKIEEGRFLLESAGTFKHGILFKDWNQVPEGATIGNQFFHSFEQYPQIAPEHMASHWINATLGGKNTERYDRWSGVQSILAAGGKCPKTWQDTAYQAPVPYSYHLDANKFAHFLKEVATARGVQHHVKHILDIKQDDRGNITSLVLEGGESIDGDFFFDCTGFASVLSRKLGATFKDMRYLLSCDRAVTIRVPFADENHAPRPYTTATARDIGWTFEIDLQARQGIGLVYSSDHAGAEEAERAIRRDFPQIPDDAELNHLRMQVGRLDRAWNKNCLALGLAAGFIEPLESTGLYMVETALRLFVDYLDLEVRETALSNRFNDIFNDLFDEAADFVFLHYYLSNRQDTPFWQDDRYNKQCPEQLRALLDLWEHKIPTDTDPTNQHLIFQSPSYAAILYGMGHLPKHVPQSVAHIPPEKSMEHLAQLQRIQKAAITSSPIHEEFLQKYTATFR
ncbi:MAG: tryptophan 7-halogenase [Pseudomonadales bacterium]|nr:tryptophan 7-halogenase [Pseudomonadales bacterium]